MSTPFQILAPDGTIRNLSLFEECELDSEDIKKIYRLMVLVRILHLEGERQAHLNHMTLFIGPMGQEAAEVASAYAIAKEERLFIYGRSWGAAMGKDAKIGRGVSPKSVFDGFFGNPDSASLEDFIFGHRTELPYISVGINISQAVGAALGPKIVEGKIIPTVCYFGDGATSEGFFHEGMNWASILEAPTVFICENNQWAISTPTNLQTATKTFAERALGYGMANDRVDGNDLFAVYLATRRALERAREKSQPTLLELVTYRLCDHTTAVGAICKIPKEEIDEAIRNDPLSRTQIFVLSPTSGIELKAEKSDAEYGAIKSEMNTGDDVIYYRTNVIPGREDKDIYAWAYREAKKAAQKSYKEFRAAHKKGKIIIRASEKLCATPIVAPKYQNISDLTPKKIVKDKDEDKKIAGVEAMGTALYDTFRFDPSLVYLGVDSGRAGGVLRLTALRKDIAAGEEYIQKELPNWEEEIILSYLPLKAVFPKRFLDTPLDERGTVGVGLGMSLSGSVRPIMEMQFSGFEHIAHAQVEEYSRHFLRCAGKRPLPGVLFMPYGGGERIEYHRECEISKFIQTPGLIVVCPSTVQDMYDMLWAAIASDKPVAYFWHINFQRLPVYNQLLRRPPIKPIEEFGIKVAREGNDVTVIACGTLTHACIKAAEMLEKKISVEVLDARVLAPLDENVIIQSVRKTGRLVAIQEEPRRLGIAAEFAAVISENKESFGYLRAPICRVTGPAMPFIVPGAKFWHYYVPQAKRIAAAIRKTVSYK